MVASVITTYAEARETLDRAFEMVALRFEQGELADLRPPREGLSSFSFPLLDALHQFRREQFLELWMRHWHSAVGQLAGSIMPKSRHSRHLDAVNTVRWKRRRREINSLIRDSPLAKPLGRPRTRRKKKPRTKKPAKKLTRMERYWRDKGGEQNRERVKRGTGKRPEPDYWGYQAAIVAWHMAHVPPEPLLTGDEAMRNVLRDRGRDRYIRFLKKTMGRK